MLLKPLVTSISIFVCFNLLWAQNQGFVDSLQRVIDQSPDSTKVYLYRDLFFEYYYSDLDRAGTYAEKMVSIAQKNKDRNLVAYAKNTLGVYFSGTDNYPEALRTFQEAMEIYDQLGNQERVSAILNNLSIVYRNKGDLKKALAMQMESLKIKEDVGADEEALAASYWNIGNIQGDIENYSESNQWYTKALDIYRTLDIPDDILSIQHLLATNYYHMDSLELAKATFLVVEQHYRKSNRPNDLAGVLDQLGIISKANGELERAEKYYLESLELALNHDEASLPGLLYRRLANLYKEQDQNEKALVYAKKALENSTRLGVRKKKITDHLVLANIYEKLGRYQSALLEQQNYHELYDSILSADNLAAMNEMEIKYQTEKKEQEIRLLEREAKIAKLQRLGLVGSILGLLALFGAIFYGLKQTIRRNEIERAKVDQELNFKNNELDLKKQELTAFALQLAHKNEVLDNIKNEVLEIRNTNNAPRTLQRITTTIESNKNDDLAWNTFRRRFEEVHTDFESTVKRTYPSVSAKDLRIMALIKMNLTSKEIANILNISNEGIKKARYRLRKKMNLHTRESLEEIILNI